MEEKRYRKGIIAIILNDKNQFLLVQLNSYKENEWNFVGGGRDVGETAEANLYREIKEELNVSRENIQILGMSSNPLKYDFPEPTIKDGILYHGQIKDQFVVRVTGDLKDLHIQPEEIRQMKWVDFSELPKYLIFQNQYENAIEVLKEVYPEMVK
jgi:putative (di)nucleoside polyphosphate hydrolase